MVYMQQNHPEFIKTMEELPIAYGWVPNISGRVTSEGYIQGRIDNNKEYVDSQAISFIYPAVIISMHDENALFTGELRIEITDESGFCKLYYIPDSTSKDPKTADELEMTGLEASLNDAWMRFRALIDSSTNPERLDNNNKSITQAAKNCVCSAMDKVVMVSEMEESNPYLSIAYRFIDHNEALTDNLKFYSKSRGYFSNPNRFWNRSKILTESAETLSKMETNAVYFNSYVRMYSVYFDGKEEEVKDKNNLRNEKMKAVANYLDRSVGIRSFRWTMISVMVAIAIGAIAIVVNICN